MFYREIIAVCSEIHIKHINTLCEQNVELLNVKLAVFNKTAGLEDLNLININKVVKAILMEVIVIRPLS